MSFLKTVDCLLYVDAESLTLRNVSRHDARVTSLCTAVDVLVRRVYDTVGAVIACAFFLYAVIAFVPVGAVVDAAAGQRAVHGRRRRRRRRQLTCGPGDGQYVTARPTTSVITAPAPMRCTAASVVSRTFSETKV